MVFGLALRIAALDAQPLKIGAQARQRALVQETGQVIGAVRQQLAPPDADEKIKILARNGVG